MEKEQYSKHWKISFPRLHMQTLRKKMEKSNPLKTNPRGLGASVGGVSALSLGHDLRVLGLSPTTGSLLSWDLYLLSKGTKSKILFEVKNYFIKNSITISARWFFLWNLQQNHCKNKLVVALGGKGKRERGSERGKTKF